MRMANTDTKCPVCGKSGLPDYHSANVVCPCCGSDLSVYHKLTEFESLSQRKGGNKIAVYSLAAFCALLVAGCLFLTYSAISQKEETAKMQAKCDSLTFVNQQVNQQLATLIDNTPQNSDAEEPLCLPYTVQSGDSFWRISRKFYGDGRKHQEIADFNGLTTDSALHPGQTLKIPFYHGTDIVD